MKTNRIYMTLLLLFAVTIGAMADNVVKVNFMRAGQIEQHSLDNLADINSYINNPNIASSINVELLANCETSDYLIVNINNSVTFTGDYQMKVKGIAVHGTLTIDGCDVVGNTYGTDQDAVISVVSGKLIVNSGNVEAKTSTASKAIHVKNDANCEINGGMMTAYTNGSAIYVEKNGNLQLKGGIFKCSGESGLTIDATDGIANRYLASFLVSGYSYYTSYTDDNTELAELDSKKKSEYTYLVVAPSVFALIGNQRCDSKEDLMSAVEAKNGAAVNVRIPFETTIDNLDFPEGSDVTIVNNFKDMLTILDGVTVANNSKLTIAGGKYVAHDYKTVGSIFYVSNGGELNFIKDKSILVSCHKATGIYVANGGKLGMNGAEVLCPTKTSFSQYGINAEPEAIVELTDASFCGLYDFINAQNSTLGAMLADKSNYVVVTSYPYTYLPNDEVMGSSLSFANTAEAKGISHHWTTTDEKRTIYVKPVTGVARVNGSGGLVKDYSNLYATFADALAAAKAAYEKDNTKSPVITLYADCEYDGDAFNTESENFNYTIEGALKKVVMKNPVNLYSNQTINLNGGSIAGPEGEFGSGFLITLNGGTLNMTGGRVDASGSTNSASVSAIKVLSGNCNISGGEVIGSLCTQDKNSHALLAACKEGVVLTGGTYWGNSSAITDRYTAYNTIMPNVLKFLGGNYTYVNASSKKYEACSPTTTASSSYVGSGGMKVKVVPANPNVSLEMISEDGETKTVPDYLWSTELLKNPNAIAFVSSDNAASVEYAKANNNIVIKEPYTAGGKTLYRYVCPKLVLTDYADDQEKADFYTPVDFIAQSGSYTRAFNSESSNSRRPSTCCLPFAFSKSDIMLGSTDVERAKYILTFAYCYPGETFFGDEGVMAAFNSVDDVEAGVPCILFAMDYATLNKTFSNTPIRKAPVANGNLIGTFSKTTAYKAEGYYGENNEPVADGPIAVGGGSILIPYTTTALDPFHCVLSLNYDKEFNNGSNHTSSLSNAKYVSIKIIGEDEITGINETTRCENATLRLKGIYNINGQRVNNDYRGIRIINGKKYMGTKH